MKSFILTLILYSFLRGLILSNALRAQKNAEDESCTIALSNLRSEAIRLKKMKQNLILNPKLIKPKLKIFVKNCRSQ
jgi:hypothetical protein